MGHGAGLVGHGAVEMTWQKANQTQCKQIYKSGTQNTIFCWCVKDFQQKVCIYWSSKKGDKGIARSRDCHIHRMAFQNQSAEYSVRTRSMHCTALAALVARHSQSSWHWHGKQHYNSQWAVAVGETISKQSFWMNQWEETESASVRWRWWATPNVLPIRKTWRLQIWVSVGSRKEWLTERLQ